MGRSRRVNGVRSTQAGAGIAASRQFVGRSERDRLFRRWVFTRL